MSGLLVIVGTGIIILRSSNPALHRPFKVPLSPIVPIITVVSAAFLMNNLPIDTWIRLIDWMSIGLVVYFAYSYVNSRLAKVSDTQANDAVPADYTPPIAAIIGVGLTIPLTIWQVYYFLPEGNNLDLAVRLFAWVVTALLVGLLMYGKTDKSGGRSSSVRSIGLIASLINLAVWAGITYWFFVHYAELHGGK